ncbi:MAG: GIY-YIG nuclease family protein [Planctomycetota bacterium]
MAQRNRRGFSVRTFLASGRPEGLSLIEHSQWIGRGLVIPRHELDKHLKRGEFRGTGIYILAGINPQTGCERIGIGQIGNLRDELEDVRGAGYWSRMLVFAADGPRLHRDHVDYIESRMIDMAREVKGAELDNDNEVDAPKLYEADEADAEHFIERLVTMLPALGVTAFEAAPPKPSSTPTLRISGNGAVGDGYEARGRFVISGGSTATRSDQGGLPGYVRDLRESLLTRGVLVEEGKQLKFAVSCSVPSAAVGASLMLAGKPDADAWKPHSNSGRGPTGRDAGDTDDRRAPTVEVKPLKAAKAQPAGATEDDDD